ncbi:hypothetical protein [Pseudothermotoga thermarum]|uniref:Uncharacterized protein n=1 Tax=Pseudothermotoga thermarum DSM 5069 TaxID=688269 RepID=F7YY75_9THEM|nr:hypothetical protein [Pseudothermotoga thermarum]AEH50896.1 hypothetical protein Theth_0812 [Pseudothermotoga thermarum DSM 5069]
MVARRQGQNIVAFFVFLFFFALVFGSVASVFSLIYYNKVRENYEARVKALENKINLLNDKVVKLENLYGQGGVIEKFINSANFLANTAVDLERIIESIYDDPTTGYIQLFVMGQENVWITFRKGDTVYFSRELKPGLAPYKFYYFKEPAIKTQYTVIIPPDCSIVIGKPGMVVFLVYGVGTRFHPTKIVTWREARVNNLVVDFSLYIPK